MNTGIKVRDLPLNQVRDVGQLLVNKSAANQLSKVAASHLKPERMMRVVSGAIRTTPKLQECEPMSFLGALMECAALGLEPNTPLGHAYLVPFKNNRKKITEVQVIIGYKGLIDLARRSGHIISISANVHYSDDDLWEYEEGTEARLRHRPGPRQGDKEHAYAIAQFKDGGHAYVVLPWHEVIGIRDGSQNWRSAVKYGKTASSPWATHEPAMARKTAIRALVKLLPLSIELVRAVELDESPADYGGYAMDPATGGATIEAQAIEEPTEEEHGPDPEPENKERPSKRKVNKPDKTKEKPSSKTETPAKSKAAKTSPQVAEKDEAPEPDSGTKDTDPVPELALVDRIISDLNEAGESGASDVLELWNDQIENLETSHPELKAKIDTAVTEIMTGDGKA